METISPCQLPHAFNRIQLRAVGREIIELDSVHLALSPFLMELRMMVSGIIYDYYGFCGRIGCRSLDHFEKFQRRFRVETVGFFAEDELSVSKSYRPKVPNSL